MVKGFITCLLCLYAVYSSAQHTIKGIVEDPEHTPVGFCHVVNKTVGLGKVSDKNGKFEILAKKGDTLHFSYVGYKSLDIEINSVHLVNYLKVTLPEDSLLLPSITIYADNNYRVPLNYKGEAMYIPGLSITDQTDIIKPGTIRPSPQGVGGIPVMGATIYGPITYFSKDEREKRHAQEAYQQTRETITYQKFIAQDSVKTKLCQLYDLDSAQYDQLIVRLNRQFPGIQKQYNPMEIWNWLLMHFERSADIIKSY